MKPNQKLNQEKHCRMENSNKKEIVMQGSKLYVGNLSYSVTSAELEELFATHGEIKQINVIEGKGFGFVEMSTSVEAEKAKEALNDTEFKGRTIRVDEARPPKTRQKRDYRRY
jgi:RNA recognition motif-containing protein